MCKILLNQIKNNPDVSHRTLALCWIFFKAHATLPLGQFIKVANNKYKIALIEKLNMALFVTTKQFHYKILI